MQHNRTGTIEFKDIDASDMRMTNDRQGIIEGLMNKTGNIDLQDDRVCYGAWRDTIKSAYARKAAGDPYLVPFLWSHNYQDGLPPGGVFYLDETKAGLYAKVQMNLAIQSGHELYESYRAGTVSKQSIGYRAVTVDWEKIEGKNIRNLRACELMECSAVVFPANPLATVSSIKRYWPGWTVETKEGRVLSQRTMGVLKKATDGITGHVNDVQQHVQAARANALAGYPVYGSSSSDEPYSIASALAALQELNAQYEGKAGAAISAENQVRIGKATENIMTGVRGLKQVMSDAAEAARQNALAGYPVYSSSSSETFDTKDSDSGEDPLVAELREMRESLSMPPARSLAARMDEVATKIDVNLALAALFTASASE
jgi:HK97 family phage prohead protease